MRTRHLLLAAIAAAALTGTLAVSPAAHASTTLQAVTTLTGRPDSGGGGTWAGDNLTRTLIIPDRPRHLHRDRLRQRHVHGDRGGADPRPGRRRRRGGDPVGRDRLRGRRRVVLVHRERRTGHVTGPGFGGRSPGGA